MRIDVVLQINRASFEMALRASSGRGTLVNGIDR